ncbi:MAG TPA: 16S rRNA (guanine(966)-N(2))-methyltransferase RsmD [Acidothermaceae bacterium]|jgi:16S rRNA (guanine966-N2)-methyltransferase|nr:16S rRNA (guanine(966)-N(2))-methyltransferase RsmD [Acidothermaceae bacterium]
MTRIVAGQAGGRRLAVPPSGTRPTSDRAREALFSSLDSALGGLQGSRFLDLYAGSGAVGLEAWSRGAAHVVLVESAAAAVKVLRANVVSVHDSRRIGITARAGKIDVLPVKAERAAAELPASGFDVIFADPPYDLPTVQVAGVLATLAQRAVPRADAIVVVERATRDRWAWPLGYAATHARKYGDATLHYARYDPSLM